MLEKILSSAAVQIPALVVFVIFTLYLFKNFQAYIVHVSAQHDKALASWQGQLTEQRESFTRYLRERDETMVKVMTDVTKELSRFHELGVTSPGSRFRARIVRSGQRPDQDT